MRLLKIGSSPDCDIVLNSKRVSALHAELVMLNNGDILLEDKGSTNGTFVNNQLVKQGASVPVRRGDLIRFADTELQWASVPQPTNNSMFKKIYGIGSNMRYNDIQVTGNTVSRFHATLKIDKQGRAYIEDHSMNGTTINGKRIAAHQNVRVKRGDDVVVGGVPVDLKSYIKPEVGGIVLKTFGGVAAIAAVVALVMMIVGPDSGCGVIVEPDKYVPSVVYVLSFYHYTAVFENDPFIPLCKEFGIPYPSEYGIGIDSEGRMGFTDLDDFGPVVSEATAFFVSKDGKMITNRHVAAPWKTASETEKDAINQIMTRLKDLSILEFYDGIDIQDMSCYASIAAAKLLKKGVAYEVLEDAFRRYKDCVPKTDGRLDYIAVGYPNRRYSDINEFERCTTIGEAKDEEVDIAMIQLNSRVTPPSVTRLFKLNNAILKKESIVPMKERYHFIGYPKGLMHNLRGGGLSPKITEVLVSRQPERYTIDLQGEVIPGTSGSPVFDKRGRLIGVISSYYTFGSTAGRCERIVYAKELFDEIEAN